MKSGTWEIETSTHLPLYISAYFFSDLVQKTMDWCCILELRPLEQVEG